MPRPTCCAATPGRAPAASNTKRQMTAPRSTRARLQRRKLRLPVFRGAVRQIWAGRSSYDCASNRREGWLHLASTCACVTSDAMATEYTKRVERDP